MVALIIIFPNIVSYGDPEAKARMEQSEAVDLGSMMQQSPDNGSSGGEQKDTGSDFLKQLQQNEK